MINLPTYNILLVSINNSIIEKVQGIAQKFDCEITVKSSITNIYKYTQSYSPNFIIIDVENYSYQNFYAQIKKTLLIPVLYIVSKPVKWCLEHEYFLKPINNREITIIISATIEQLKKQKQVSTIHNIKGIINRIPIMLHALNAEGKIIDVSNYWLKIMGYTKEEVIGKHSTDFLTPEMQKETLKNISQIHFVQQEAINKEYQLVTKLGETVSVLISSFNEYDENNKIIHTFGIVTDISKRKEFERNIIQLKDKLNAERQMFIHGPYVLFKIKNDKNLSVEYVSLNAKQHLGFESNDFISGKISYLNRIEKKHKELVYNELNDALENKKSIFEIKDYQWQHASGEYIWINHYFSTIKDQTGNITHILAYVSNANEKKQAQLDLLKHKSALDQSAIVVILDNNGKITYCNNKLLELTGYTEDYYIGQTSNIFNSSYHDKSFTNQIINTIKKGQIWQGELKNKSKSGKLYWLYTTVVPFLDNEGNPYQYLSIRFDITPRKQMEEKIKSHNKQLNSIVERRTQELKFEKNKVEKINSELLLKNKHIEEINREIYDSIRYAHKIQQALLPSQNTILSYFKDYFIYFKPKDVLSGDFYWIGKQNNKIIFSIADCTGHGVPGAFMSMLGISMLNYIVNDNKITQSANILEELHITLMRVMQSRNEQTHIMMDGMDIALCVLDNDNMTLEYCGALRPLYLIRDNSLTIIKGNRFSIGGIRPKGKYFVSHKIEIKPNDMLYLFSDGYPDQIGSIKNKKIKTGRFRKFIFDIHKENLNEQKILIDKFLTNWKHNNDQIDDILIWGIRI